MNPMVRSIVLVSACSSLLLSGCQSNSHLIQHRVDHSLARLSFLSWNARSTLVTPREASTSRAFAIASLSNRELAELMESKPSPDVHQLSGAWNGINKGFGPALAGLTQDVKVFDDHGCCVHGHNRIVHQVPICKLQREGWKSKVDSKTCEPKTIGNFLAIPSKCKCSPLQLDYTQAENPWYDPSKLLIDDIVQIEPDLLLGRAHVSVGTMKIPVAYFVLFR